MCLERLTVRNGWMIRNIFGLFSCKNQGKNGYFPVIVTKEPDTQKTKIYETVKRKRKK